MNSPPIKTQIALVQKRILAEPGFLDPPSILAAYRTLGFLVEPEPTAATVTESLLEAMRSGQPYSVIRIGDSEAAMLAHGDNPSLASLEHFAVSRSVAIHSTLTDVDTATAMMLGDWMHRSIEAANVVGVLGLWRPVGTDSHTFAARMEKDPRGMLGQWYGAIKPLEMATKGLLDGKLIASAHLYFGIITRIQVLLRAAKSVLLITSHEGLAARMLRLNPQIHIHTIVANKPSAENVASRSRFLEEVRDQLPPRLTGTLCLVGSGPWAEIYCTWVKERGGIAVDVGSGMDLLMGRVTRPVHRRIEAAMEGRFEIRA